MGLPECNHRDTSDAQLRYRLLLRRAINDNNYTIPLTPSAQVPRPLHSRTSQAPVRLQRQLERDEHGQQRGAGHHRRRCRHAVLHSGRIVALEHVHQDATRLGVARLAGVVARVSVRRLRHLQPALPACEVGAHVDTLLHVEVDHAEVVIPEEVRRHLGGLLHQAVQLQGAAWPDEFLRRAGYLRFGFCKWPNVTRET